MTTTNDIDGAVGAAALTAALDYAARGWPVLPLHSPLDGACSCRRPECSSPAKHPRLVNGSTGASRESAVIERWWQMWPTANVGVATGKGSATADPLAGGGLVVLDVDPDHGGSDALHELEAHHGELPETVCAETGSGGAHYYFTNREVLRNSTSRLGSGLDVRGAGGYVVAPPSVHVSGRRYEWDVEPGTPAPLPEWLLVLLRADSQGKARPASAWRRLAAEGATPGERNNRTAQLAGHLLARDVDPYVCLELVVAWDERRNKPPLGRPEVARTVASIARKEAERWNR